MVLKKKVKPKNKQIILNTSGIIKGIVPNTNITFQNIFFFLISFLDICLFTLSVRNKTPIHIGISPNNTQG